MCNLDSGQIENLLGPSIDVLRDLEADPKGVERIIELANAVQDAKLLESLQETGEFLQELLSVGSINVNSDLGPLTGVLC